MFEIKNFTYNGWCGKQLSRKAPYTAEFKKWTNDPGVAVFYCSDGKERLIPTFTLIGDKSILPEQSYENKVIFGKPCRS